MFRRHRLACLLVLGAGGCASGPPRPPQLPLCSSEPSAEEARWLALSDALIQETADPARLTPTCRRPLHVQQAFRARLPRMSACYDQARARDAEARGNISARFTLARDGEVPLMCIATSEIQDAELVECLLHVLEDVELPAAEAGCHGPDPLRVTYPLVFAPSDAAATRAP